MTPERWQQVKDVLHQVLQLPPLQRKSFLETACERDQALQHEVESLLAEQVESTEGFLQSAAASGLDIELHTPSWVGQHIGSYEVVEMIGEGGMGVSRRSR